MKTIIETEQLILREMTMDDFDALHAIFSDPQHMRHYPEPFSREKTASWIERNQERYKNHGYGLWAVVLKAENRVIGDCGITLQNIAGEQLPEIGYHIDKAYTRKGYATQVARACKEYAFETLGFEKIYSYMNKSNIPSQKVAENNGMTKIEEWDRGEDVQVVYMVEKVQMRKMPITTLFMLMSVDGKISTGAADELDVDKDYPTLDGVKEGLHQYYEIERTTDLWSFNTGRVQAKIGVNTSELPDKTPVSFVVMDNSHLTERGVQYFCRLSKVFVLITSNSKHPAFSMKEDNLNIIFQEKADIKAALEKLHSDYGCERLTIQSGGTVNGLFLREKLFDYVDIVVAPVLVGGKNTATLIDGESIKSPDELNKLGVLELMDCEMLKNSYIRLKYRVVK